MATDRATKLAQWAYAAGFRGDSLITAVSVGLSESGGNPNAHNPKPPDDSYGLYQINYYGSLGPARTKAFGPATGLFDPIKNAQAAYTLSGGGVNWKPWQADWNNNAVYRNMNEARDGVNAFLGGPTAPGAPGSPIVAGADVNAGTNVGGEVDAPGNPCLLKLPNVVGIGGGCIFKLSQARAIGGALILASGVLIGGAGLALLIGVEAKGLVAHELLKGVMPSGGKGMSSVQTLEATNRQTAADLRSSRLQHATDTHQRKVEASDRKIVEAGAERGRGAPVVDSDGNTF